MRSNVKIKSGEWDESKDTALYSTVAVVTKRDSKGRLIKLDADFTQLTTVNGCMRNDNNVFGDSQKVVAKLGTRSFTQLMSTRQINDLCSFVGAGYPGDEAGHVHADEFMGSDLVANIVPMAPNENQVAPTGLTRGRALSCTLQPV
jgi:hypothetical protein